MCNIYEIHDFIFTFFPFLASLTNRLPVAKNSWSSWPTCTHDDIVYHLLPHSLLSGAQFWLVSYGSHFSIPRATVPLSFLCSCLYCSHVSIVNVFLTFAISFPFWAHSLLLYQHCSPPTRKTILLLPVPFLTLWSLLLLIVVLDFHTFSNIVRNGNHFCRSLLVFSSTPCQLD